MGGHSEGGGGGGRCMWAGGTSNFKELGDLK